MGSLWWAVGLYHDVYDCYLMNSCGVGCFESFGHTLEGHDVPIHCQPTGELKFRDHLETIKNLVRFLSTTIMRGAHQQYNR
jgi:hypothetical protein